MKVNKYQSPIDDELDLHGQYVNPAMEMLREFLAQAQRNGFRSVRVITGKGIHSEQAGVTIRESVIGYLDGKYQWTYDKSNNGLNSGAIIVKMK